MKIIEEKNDFIIYKNDDNETIVTPNNVYNNLKLSEYNNERILYEKGKYSIQETYDPMIFNISDGKNHLQTRKLDCNRVAEAVKSLKKDDVYHFEDLFNAYNGKDVDIAMLEGMIKAAPGRVVMTQKGFLVDERFLVDRKGSSWIKRYERGPLNNDGFSDYISGQLYQFKYLCLVARYGTSTKIKKKDGEIVHISQTANQILSKVQFCLDAKKHIGDAVFWNQVPDQMKKEIERD